MTRKSRRWTSVPEKDLSLQEVYCLTARLSMYALLVWLHDRCFLNRNSLTLTQLCKAFNLYFIIMASKWDGLTHNSGHFIAFYET